MQAAGGTRMETDGQSQGEDALAPFFSRTWGFQGDSLIQPFSDDNLKSISNILLYDGKSSGAEFQESTLSFASSTAFTSWMSLSLKASPTCRFHLL